MDVGEAGLSKFREQPLGVFFIGLGAGDAAPELRMALSR